MHRRTALPLLSLAAMLIVVAWGCARVQPHLELPDLTLADAAFVPTLEAYTATPVMRGNRVRLLLNGDEIFPAQLAAIRAARRTLTYAQYFYEDGPVSREIAGAIAERCRAGVRAHVLLDGFGTLLMPREYRRAMEQAGCEVAVFRPLGPLALLSPFGIGDGNKRNHRRILVVDGRVGFTGGSGVSARWMGDGRTRDHWRETDVRLEGPVVEALQGAFAENWLEATGRVLGGAPYFPSLAPVGDVTAQVVRSSPAGGSFAMYTMFLLAMHGARRSILITNPYVVLDDRMLETLTAAARRGVRVALLSPGPIDNNIVRQASRSRYGVLLRAGVEIHEYQSGLLHAKTMVVDGRWATVGSTNLDNRSFALNEELNVVLYDRHAAERLEGIFAEDLRHSRRLTYERWRRRGPLSRLLELVAWPVEDQL